MPVYCAYIVGLHDRTIGVVQLDCINDESAIKSARRLVDSHDVELWQTDRPVARFDARSKQLCKKIAADDEPTSVAMLRSSHGIDFGISTWGQKLPFRMAAQCDSALSRAVVLFAVRRRFPVGCPLCATTGRSRTAHYANAPKSLPI